MAGSCETSGFEIRSDGLSHCKFCGSIDIDTAIRLLETAGVRYSGADWKYGFPHKFYLGTVKFYTNHAAHATADQLSRWNDLADQTVGVRLEIGEGGLMYRALSDGYQAAGVVGGERSTYGRGGAA